MAGQFRIIVPTARAGSAAAVAGPDHRRSHRAGEAGPSAIRASTGTERREIKIIHPAPPFLRVLGLARTYTSIWADKARNCIARAEAIVCVAPDTMSHPNAALPPVAEELRQQEDGRGRVDAVIDLGRVVALAVREHPRAMRDAANVSACR